MRKGLRTFISLMLVFCMMMPGITTVVSAAGSRDVPEYDPQKLSETWFRLEDFENYEIGAKGKDGFANGIIDEYEGQKVLKITTDQFGLSNKFKQIAAGQYCVSFDIAAPSNKISGDVRIEGGGDGKRELCTISHGRIRNHNGREVGAIGKKFTRVTIVVAHDERLFSMWINGQRVTNNSYYKSVDKTDKGYEVYFRFYSDDEEKKDVYLDNLVIQSTSVKSEFSPIYNPYAYTPRDQTLVFTEEPDRVYTEKYGAFTNVTSSMAGRTAIHMRTGVIHTDYKHYRLDNMPYYEGDEEEFMVPVEAFEDLLGVAATVEGNNIKLGNRATLTIGEKAIDLNGVKKAISFAPAEKDGVVYLPLSAVATTVFYKNVYHETEADYSPGAVIIGDGPFTSFTVGSTSLQFLNDMLFAERPTWQKLIEDYNASPLKGQHPRIYITRDGVENLKKEIESNELKKNWYEHLITTADRNVGRAPFEWVLADGVRMLTQASTFEYYVRTQGMAYLLTGDEKYAEDAWEKIVSVAMMPDWNPAHTLDAGTYAGGFALAYDWFYDWMNQEQRDFMYEHAYRNYMWYMNESYKGEPYASTSVIYRTNWNAVVNSGTVLTSLAFFDVNPEFCARNLQEAIRCLEYAIQKFGPEGYWEEGISYLHMTLFYTVMALSGLETVFNDCYTLDLWQGFDKAADQLTYAQSDVSGYNYGNAVMGWSTTIALFWFFDHFNMEGIADTLAYNPRFKDSYTADVVNLLMWYRPTGVDEPVYTLDKIWRSPSEDVVTARNTYDDGQVFVGFKSRMCDGVNRNHGHQDGGSFVFDAQGVRWAYDIGKEEYDIPGYMSGGPEKSKIFRWRAGGHNTLVINPGFDAEHSDSSGGKIVEYEAKPRGVKAVIDMTGAQSANANKASRGFLFTDERTSLVIRDEVELKGQSKLMWLMYIQSNYEVVDDNTVILSDKTSKDKKVKIEFISNVPGAARVEDAAPFETAPYVSGQKTNSEFKRLVYETNGSGKVTITAKLTPMLYEGTPVKEYDVPISEWTIPDGEIPPEPVLDKLIIDGQEYGIDQRLIKVSVPSDKSPVPEVEAISEKYGVLVEKPETVLDVTTVYVWDKKDPNAQRYKYMIEHVPERMTRRVDGVKLVEITEVKASATPEPENFAENVLDGKMETRWTSERDQTFIMTLEDGAEIDTLVLAPYIGKRITYFDILLSDDGEKWTTVFEGGTSGGEAQQYELYDLGGMHKVKYVKLAFHGANNATWNNIAELAVGVKTK